MSDPKEILERRLDRVAEEQQVFALHFFCQISSDHARGGLTTLQIAGSGQTLLSWKNAEFNKLFSVQLSETDHVKFYKILRAHPFWDATPARRAGNPDEASIHLRFSDQAAGTHGSLQFWNDDIADFPVLAPLMRSLLGLIHHIAQDEIPDLGIRHID